MAFEHYFPQEWKSIPNAVTETETENPNACFDCNICLDFAHEPVVTLCGHLYCWPCIYKWLHVQSASLASDEHPQCPVCKADICHTTMVPLYGRGHQPSCPDLFIPPRPSPSVPHSHSQSAEQLPYRNPYQNQPPPSYPQEDHTSQGATITPLVGMFGDMFYARVFGNSYPNSYHLMGGNSPRLRRQEMQADKSLNRISVFLLCCFLLCLIVF